MRQVLVAVLFVGAVVRLEDESALLVPDADASNAWPLSLEDPYRPALVPAGEQLCVVGGLLPPGAVAAEVIDDGGDRIRATVANGAYIAYIAVLDQHNKGREPIVCCYGSDGAPVSRPPAAGYRVGLVEDADVPCPACGALDFEEYLPSEAGSSGPTDSEGNAVPQLVVRCRVCGQQEPEGLMVRAPNRFNSLGSALTRDQLAAKADVMRREFMWGTIQEGVTVRGFPIYVATAGPHASANADQRTTAD